MTSATQPPPVPPPRVDEAVPECPYVGLVPFEESDAPYFFGRQRECALIVANLTVSRLTLLYAASGVGKSSVLQASVLPQFQQIARESSADLEVPGAAVGYVREWSRDPLEAIATEVLHAVSRVPGASPIEGSGPARLSVPWLRAVLEHSGVEAVYLVLDQFEEYFLYHPAEPGTDGLAGALGELLSARDLPVNVLVSIREDALAALDRFKGWVPRLYENYLRLAHLGRQAAQAAIEGPLEHYNQVAPPDSAMTVEPELIKALLDQVRTGQLVVTPEEAAFNGAPADRDDIEAPYLQLVLTRLWDAERARGSSKLRRSTLEELGGAQTIAQNHLNTVLADLSPEQTEVAAAVFRHLITPSGSKIAQTAGDLADLSGVSVSSVQELVQSLSAGRQRILRPVPPPAGVAGPPRYEIFHDVLGTAVLDWRRRYLAQRAQAEASRTLVAEREKAEVEREKAEAEQQKAQAEARAARRQLRKIRLLAAGLAVVLLVAGALGALLYLTSGEAEKQRLLSEAATTRSYDPLHSLHSALKANQISNDADTREAVLMVASAPRSTVIAGPPMEKDKVVGIVVTPDQRHVVTYNGLGGIRVIDDQGQPTKAAKASHLTGTVVTAATSPSALQVALGTDQGSAAVVDIGTGRQVDLATDRSPVSALGWLESFPDNLVLVQNASDVVATYSATTGRQVVRFPIPVSEALPLANAQVVTSDQQDSRLRVWNARTAEKVAESSPLPERTKYLRPYGHEVVGASGHNIIRWDWRASTEPRQYPVTFSNALLGLAVNESTHMVTIAADKEAMIYDLNDGTLQCWLPRQPDLVFDVALDPHGQWIATAGGDGRIRVWSAKNKGTLTRATYDFISHRSRVVKVMYLHDGKALVSQSVDGTVRLWDIPVVKRFYLPNWVLGLDVSADGRWLAAASADSKVHIVNPAGDPNMPVVTIPVGDHVGDVKFDPTEEHRVITLSWYKTQPEAWRWSNGGATERLLTFERPPLLFSSDHLVSLDISQDGERVAAGDVHGNVYLWDAHTGRLIGNLVLRGSGDVSGVAFDPSGHILAATSPDGVHLMNLDTREELKLLSLPHATWVAFDQHGKYIVGADYEGGVLRVWRTRDGQRVNTFHVHGGGIVGRPSFSRDDRLVAAGTGEGRIEVWDVLSGKVVMLVRQHGDMVNDVRFLPGSPSRLASASDDSTVAVFPCEACEKPDNVIQEAENWVRRNPR